MNIRLGSIAYACLLTVASIAGGGCLADNRLGLQPDGGDGSPPVVYYFALTYSPARGRLTVAGDGGLMTFDPVTGAKLKTVDPGGGLAVITREAGDVTAAAQLGNLWLFDPTGKLQRNIKHAYQVYSLALSPDGAVVYSGSIDGKVRRFRTTDGAPITPALGPDSQDFVNDVAVSSDGLYVAAAEQEGVRVWRTVDGAPILHIPGRSERARFAPDGSELTVVDDLGAATYTIPDGAEIRRYDVEGTMSRIAYSSDGAKLALTTGSNKVVKVFDTKTGASLVSLSDASELRLPEQPLSRTVSELSFVQGDARLAVAWFGGRLAEWDVADGTLLWSRLDSDKP
jgi:WD40 repeat protein